MVDLAYWALLLLYVFLGVRVDQWTTIKILGFGSETPQAFLENPGGYALLRNALFLATAGSLIGASIPWLLGLGLLGAGWFATTWIGQALAFRSYRNIFAELAQNSETEEDRRFALDQGNKSNAELRDIVVKRSKGVA
jgi:hypothetical protein